MSSPRSKPSPKPTKTLSSGIIYEKPPHAPLPRELYAALIAFISEVKKQQAERAGSVGLKDTEVFLSLGFSLPHGSATHQTARPRSRRFIEFLRGQFPQSPNFSAKNPASSFPSDFFTLNRACKKCEHVILRASERYPAAAGLALFICCATASQLRDNCEQVTVRLFSTHGRAP